VLYFDQQAENTIRCFIYSSHTLGKRIKIKRLLLCAGYWALTVNLVSGQCYISSVIIRNVTCYDGNNGQIIVSASAGTAPYTYSISPDPGTQSPSGTFNGLPAGDYSIAITDIDGCVTSGNYTITQPSLPLSITSQPLPQTDCYGNVVEYSVVVGGVVGTVSYQWQQMPPAGTFTNLDGETGATLTIPDIGVLGLNVNATLYRVVVTDECQTITSVPALLTINSITNLTPAVVNSTICDGGSITYEVYTEGSVVGYQWFRQEDINWIPVSDDIFYSGTTTSQLTILNATAVQSSSYRVSVTFNTLNQPVGYPTCVETSTTRTRNLIVRDPLSITIVTGIQQICFNSTPFPVSATPASGGSGPLYSYQWQSSPTGSSLWSDINLATSLSYSPPSLTATIWYRIVASDGGVPECLSVASLPVVITVYPLPPTSPIRHN